MIKPYKGDLVYASCSIRILSNKRTMTFAMDYVISDYGHLHNLGGHNALNPLPTLCEPIGSHT